VFTISAVSRFWLLASVDKPRVTTKERETAHDRFKEILDEAFAGVLYRRSLMLLAGDAGQRTERINRTDFWNCG
jgi:hypothetical protein